MAVQFVNSMLKGHRCLSQVFSRSLPQATCSLSGRRSFYLYSPEPFHPIRDKEPKWMTAEEAVQIVTSGN